MRTKSLIGIGALTTAALLGGFTATAQAAVAGDDHGNHRENDRGYDNTLHGYKIVSDTFDANGYEQTVLCPSGAKVTGGGVDTNPYALLLDTFPATDGKGWTGAAYGLTDGATMTVYAICTKVGDNHYDH